MLKNVSRRFCPLLVAIKYVLARGPLGARHKSGSQTWLKCLARFTGKVVLYRTEWPVFSVSRHISLGKTWWDTSAEMSLACKQKEVFKQRKWREDDENLCGNKATLVVPCVVSTEWLLKLKAHFFHPDCLLFTCLNSTLNLFVDEQ